MLAKRLEKAFGNLNLAFSERRALLALLDVVCLEAALFMTMRLAWPLVRPGGPPPLEWQWFALLAIVWVPVSLAFDCYNLKKAADRAHLSMAAGAAAVTVLSYLAIPYVTPYLLTSRLLVLVLVGASAGLVTLWRATYQIVFISEPFLQRVMVVGAGVPGTAFARMVKVDHKGYYRIVGFIDEDKALHGTMIAGCPVLGGSEELAAAVAKYECRKLVVAIPNLEGVSNALLQAIIDAQEQGVEIVPMPLAYEELSGQVPIDLLVHGTYMLLPIVTWHPHRVYRIFKWCADLSFAALGMVALALLSPAIALANAVSSPGPLFYRQSRVGRGGQVFTLLKFRSMIVNAENGEAQWAREKDERVTPVGRLLRRTRLDELPQVINILRGEMSLVGPRPERPSFVAELAEKIPFYRLRHATKPGITGWAQVSYPYGASVSDARTKLEYDLFYIKSQSIVFDVQVILKTLSVILKLSGR